MRTPLIHDLGRISERVITRRFALFQYRELHSIVEVFMHMQDWNCEHANYSQLESVFVQPVIVEAMLKLPPEERFPIVAYAGSRGVTGEQYDYLVSAIRVIDESTIQLLEVPFYKAVSGWAFLAYQKW